MDEFQRLADQLRASPNHQVISRVARTTTFNPDDGSPKRIGLLVDVETTGLDTANDKIIELGCILFEYGLNGIIYRILEEYNGLEDPGQPLDPLIVELTGIVDTDLNNQKLDDTEVNQLIARSDFVIAHNSSFDRPMLERRFPQFVDKPWGCSLQSVNWQDEGISSGKLDYILFKLGKFHEGHRAVEDCHATLFILGAELAENHSTAMAQVLQKARDPDCRVFAHGAEYDVKDELKARGYKWSDGANGRAKSWYLDVSEGELVEEARFLLDGRVIGPTVPMLKLNPVDLYTDRSMSLPPEDSWYSIPAPSMDEE
ncbi:MAG: 3'-5' exonuclease [Sneathiella sp.]